MNQEPEHQQQLCVTSGESFNSGSLLLLHYHTEKTPLQVKLQYLHVTMATSIILKK